MTNKLFVILSCYYSWLISFLLELYIIIMMMIDKNYNENYDGDDDRNGNDG